MGEPACGHPNRSRESFCSRCVADAINSAYELGRKDGLEKAAQVCESYGWKCRLVVIDAIRREMGEAK